ncbi:MAG: hypothetical protein PUP93_27605 [Rhizonema sp. NSF051]|nr:hypothetical protein [Rhizonema sp. NSF051]
MSPELRAKLWGKARGKEGWLVLKPEPEKRDPSSMTFEQQLIIFDRRRVENINEKRVVVIPIRFG